MPSHKQSKAHRRREQRLRASYCRSVAIGRGYRHVTPLLDVIAEYGAINDGVLAHPSQETMAQDLGVCVRTIRYWLAQLKDLGLVNVYESPPRPWGPGGKWTRKTNRYLLCDRRARAAGNATPLPRSFKTGKSQQSSPTGNTLPVTLIGNELGKAAHQRFGPSQCSHNEFVETIVVESAPPIIPPNNLVAVTTKPDPKRTREGLSAARAALKRARNR